MKMNKGKSAREYVVCIQNEGYKASLEVRKIYQQIPDDEAAKHRLIRIVDESGEDYLYPLDFFAAIDLPDQVAEVFSRAA